MSPKEEIEFLKLKLADTERLLNECISRQNSPHQKTSAITIYQFTAKKQLLRSFPSLSKAARCMGTDKTTLQKRCESGQQYKGYYWSYSKKCG